MRKPFFTGLQKQGDLIARASDWRGTPFRPNARLMGVGVDCVQLAGAIYVATGLIETFDPGHYTMDGGQHAQRSRVIEYIESTGRFDLVWKREGESPLALIAGDLLCFEIGKQPHHVGIAVSPVKFTHVYRGYTVKESQVNDTTWRKRLSHVYRPVTSEELPEGMVLLEATSAMGKTTSGLQGVRVIASNCIPCQQRRARA